MSVLLSDNLQPHPLALLFRPFTDDEFADLVADIRTNGQQHPIMLHEGQILDGVHRYRACIKAGIKPHGEQYTGTNPAAYVCSANLHRRQENMTPAQKRALIAEVLKASPELSDRQVGKITKTSDKTVASERAGLESRSEIRTSPIRKDTQGRKQKVRKSKTVPSGQAILKARNKTWADIQADPHLRAEIETRLAKTPPTPTQDPLLAMLEKALAGDRAFQAKVEAPPSWRTLSTTARPVDDDDGVEEILQAAANKFGDRPPAHGGPRPGRAHVGRVDRAGECAGG
jgi:cell wall-associated NlpC family hydrolase